MAQRPEGLARFGDKLILGFCVAVSLWLMTLDEETRIEQGSRWAHRLTTPLEWAVRVVDDVTALRAQNEELRARIAALQLDASHIASERERLEELGRRAGFYEAHRGKLVAATVLELVVSRIPIQAKIRCTEPDSLRPLLPVVTENGLVGRIREVLGRDTALVQLLTDEESRVSVRSVSHDVSGLLRFDGRYFFMDHVPQGDPIAVGDVIVSSDLGGTLPRGIPVGLVTEVRASASELFKQVEVETYVRFSALDQVYVVVRPGPWYSLPGDAILEAGERGPSDGDGSSVAESASEARPAVDQRDGERP